MRPNNFDLRRTGAIVLCLAAAMFATSCGGNASKKKAADIVTEAEQKAEEVTKAKSVSTSWQNNDFTKQVPKPDIELTAAGEASLGYSANFKNATLAEVKAYAAKVKAAGFDKNAYESDGDMYNFTAENAAGWSVMISWATGQSGVLISKPR